MERAILAGMFDQKEQAEEYLRAAQHSFLHGDFNAATGTAVDAGINAADAVAGMNVGLRWKGPHEQAADLWELYSVGRESTPDAAQWRTELNRPLAN